ncbi:hypothetical protein HYDPIDRAFT_86271 [Hydnomerulius pinastri MD-312]|nr:hypothetical protein HYDPIDRAFT_86271 [Hydnomerulius pinastri MD-312]
MSFDLLSATRFDPFLETLEWNNDPDGKPSPYLLLSYQLDRLVLGAQRSRWEVSELPTYAKLKATCDEVVQEANGADKKTPLKIRVVFTPSGEMTATASPVEPLQCDPMEPSRTMPGAALHAPFEPILTIHVDTEPTSGTASMKTTNRQAYDDARARAGIPPVGTPRPHDGVSDHPDDVILFNVSNAVTESSICNVAFYRDGKWLTPPLAVGCISGVIRRWLLENGRIYEAAENSILLGTIKDNDWVLVFNGVIGCRLGRVRLQIEQYNA